MNLQITLTGTEAQILKATKEIEGIERMIAKMNKMPQDRQEQIESKYGFRMLIEDLTNAGQVSASEVVYVIGNQAQEKMIADTDGTTFAPRFK